MGDEKKKTVLVVDDEKSNIMALSHILSPEYTVYASKDGQDAIDTARQFQPDVILLDVLMPDMDGYEVLRELKAADETREIPVIFVTGLSGGESEKKGLSLGAADYISKPFNPAIVVLRVQNQIRIVAQMREILARELAEQSLRSKSEFLSRMSHELRTPMNAIIGMTRLARKDGDPDRKNEYLDKADMASCDLLRLIDSVLDVSAIMNDEISLDQAEFSLKAGLSELIGGMEAEIGAKRHNLSVELGPSTPERLFGDEKRFFQVISILLSNAIKFTPEQGNIRLEISASEAENGEIMLKAEVKDNGIGISVSQVNDLFALFEQADGGVSRKYGGVGSGLFIAKHLAGMMGGGIEVESNAGAGDPDGPQGSNTWGAPSSDAPVTGSPPHGKGAKFTFTAKLLSKSPDADSGDPIHFEGKTALVVDDVEINREIMIAVLEETGMAVECAGDGLEALKMFEAAPDRFDIILMDINMPGMDGVEATRNIRKLATPKGLEVPIIALTANVHPEQVAGYIEAGIDGHIGKPIDCDALVQTLRRHFARR